ncbi:hypothetical protein TspCOW1_00440 [Thiohalobacter sp. COW1]|nr:hypothetical protein TspCOW1_00440 [Thiohalobacter sp. COW1]
MAYRSAPPAVEGRAPMVADDNEVGADLADKIADGLGRRLPYPDGAGSVQPRLAQACEAYLKDGADVGTVFFRQIFLQRTRSQEIWRQRRNNRQQMTAGVEAT